MSNVINLSSLQKRELTLKFLVIGDYGVGKTSIVRRYIHRKFSSSYKTTVGVDYSQKIIQWDPNTTLHVQLWDVAGNQKFRSITRVYYKHAVGAALVFDVTRMDSLQTAKLWLNDIRKHVRLPDGSSIPIILLANKGDLDPGTLLQDQIVKFCEENGIRSWCATSAKMDVNIDKALGYLVEYALKINAQEEPHDGRIQLYVQPRKSSSDKCCVL